MSMFVYAPALSQDVSLFEQVNVQKEIHFVALHWHHGSLNHCNNLLFLFANSRMNDITNKKPDQIHVETFATIQTVSINKSSVSTHKQINFLHSPINQKLCRRMQLSYKSQSKTLEALKQTERVKMRIWALNLHLKEERFVLTERL